MLLFEHAVQSVPLYLYAEDVLDDLDESVNNVLFLLQEFNGLPVDDKVELEEGRAALIYLPLESGEGLLHCPPKLNPEQHLDIGQCWLLLALNCWK